MNRILLTSDGQMMEIGQPITKSPLMYLGHQVELDADFTLRSYFKLFELYPLLAQLNPFFPSYLDQYRSCPAAKCVYDGFDHLEFGKTVEMIGFPGKPRLEIYHWLRAIAGSTSLEIKDLGLEHLLDMSIKLGKLKHIVFGDKVDSLEFETVFNLFEFIDGILWELSFQGTLTACELRR